MESSDLRNNATCWLIFVKKKKILKFIFRRFVIVFVNREIVYNCRARDECTFYFT